MKTMKELRLPLKKKGGPLEQVKQFNRTKSNSTSSLFGVDSTISSPNVDELLHCIAKKIHTIVQDGYATVPKLHLNIFDERIHPILDFSNNQFPDVPTIYNFIDNIFTREHLADECAIMMLAYIERMQSGITIDNTNWRRVVISTSLLASKVWEDLAVWNVDFRTCFPSLTAKELSELERELLHLLSFNVSVKAGMYTQYYFELRQLSSTEFRVQLDKKGAKALEYRTNNTEDKLRDFYQVPSIRSKSMSDIETPPKSPRSVIN